MSEIATKRCKWCRRSETNLAAEHTRVDGGDFYASQVRCKYCGALGPKRYARTLGDANYLATESWSGASVICSTDDERSRCIRATKRGKDGD